VRMECTGQPCMFHFELWLQHAILAPVCGVLVLPLEMSAVALELNARALDDLVSSGNV
jgi:hypothetical protein